MLDGLCANTAHPQNEFARPCAVNPFVLTLNSHSLTIRCRVYGLGCDE